MTERPASVPITVGDRFVLFEELGHGGMGTVWRARDEALGREVALKELRLPFGLDDEARDAACARAVREAQASARLRHPGIIVVHDVFVHDGRPWIVMRLLHGRSLEAALETGPLEPRRTAQLGLQLLDALSVAHAAGVLHRDIKPGNIFLTSGDRSNAGTDGQAILTDFGIASVEGQATITRSGMFIGSPGFIAPERLRGETPGPQSDLWSLAATLYQAVEGMTPYENTGFLGVLASVLTQEPRSPKRSGELGGLLLAMLAKDPSARPEPLVVRQVLESIAQGAPEGTVTVPRPLDPQPSKTPIIANPQLLASPTRPRRTALAAVSLVVVLASAGAAVAVVAKGRPWLQALAANGTTVPTPRPSVSPTASGSQVPNPNQIPNQIPSQIPSPSTDAKFSDSFDPCGLIPVARVRQLIPKFTQPKGAVGGQPGTPSCSWDAPGAGFSVELGGDHRAWPDNTADAHDRFVTLQRGQDGSDKIIWHYDGIGGESLTSGPSTAAKALPEIGDEAFVVDIYGRKGAQMTEVYLRVSNLIVTVTYADVTGSTPKATIRSRAVQLARWTAEALEKRP